MGIFFKRSINIRITFFHAYSFREFCMTLPVCLPPFRARFRALETEREREWSPEALALGVNQRATLVREHAIAGATLHRGDVLPPAVLTDIQGGTRSLDSRVVSRVAAASPPFWAHRIIVDFRNRAVDQDIFKVGCIG